MNRRVSIRAVWERLFPKSSCSQLLIQLLHTTYELSLLSFQHLDIASGDPPSFE
jgi:hypothetical protein